MNNPKIRSSLSKSLGFTLVEVLVTTVVALIILGITTKLIESGTKKVSGTTNSFHAIHLSSKVFYDVMEESRVQGNLLSAINDFPELSTKNQVVDALSIYFRYIKDREDPWGYIDMPTEGGIRPEDGGMYQDLKPFSCEMKASSAAPPSSFDWKKDIANCWITLSWNEKNGAQRQYKIESNFLNPVGPSPIESLDIDESFIQSRMLEILFPGSTQTLDQIISSSGLDRDLTLAVGKVGVLTDASSTAIASLASQIADLEKKSAQLNPNQKTQLVKYQRSIAKLADKIASTIYQVLSECAPQMKIIKERGTLQRISAIPASSFLMALKGYKTISGDLSSWINRARSIYQWMLQDGLILLLSQREREFSMFKTLDALRLQVALGFISDAELKQFISNEQKMVHGRNPYLEQLFLREENLASNLAETRKRFPNVDLICTRLQVEVVENIKMVHDFFLAHPGIGGGGG
ncbi:MAG: hypothetical protein HQM08_28745 [Candidatus Riflebacteria bacterium]|nr:hypothetical protein [Candidatus Riflebacteria bacterium]